MPTDLNADLAESHERWESGQDRDLLAVVTSVNVCCGAYAGDEALMRATCEAAVERGVTIGAQVGYRDRAGFGRVPMDIGREELTDELTGQIALLQQIAQQSGGQVSYVKPHGALYNRIVSDPDHAAAVIDSVLFAGRSMPLLGLPGSTSLSLAGKQGLTVVEEGFADRAYTPTGTLVPRDEPGAVLNEPAAVAAQAISLMERGVRSICVHSDSPGALNLARAVRDALTSAGVTLTSFA